MGLDRMCALCVSPMQLCTAAAGVPPRGLLANYLDCGTSNEAYLRDPLCLGQRQHRPSMEDLLDSVGEFVEGGLVDCIISALGQQGAFSEDAHGNIRMFDTHDLLSESPHSIATVENLRPTNLIEMSTVSCLVDRQVVQAMARLNARPIVFALSNPTEKHECLPADAYAWPQAAAVYATGVQYPPVPSNGHIYTPSHIIPLYL